MRSRARALRSVAIAATTCVLGVHLTHLPRASCYVRQVKRWLRWFLLAIPLFLSGYVTGWVRGQLPSERRIDRVVAMSWGDGRYGRAFYGAHVYLEPLDEQPGYAVHVRVYIHRGTFSRSYFHDMGEIGRAASDEEAVARWGTLTWRPDGLQIGNEPNAPFLPRETLENHR